MARTSLALGMVLCLNQTGLGQAPGSTIDKAQALREVKVTSIRGWKEVVSEEGRFRVLFPGSPTASNDVLSVTGFNFAGPDANWSASYSDFSNSTTDEGELRNHYRNSVKAVARGRLRIIRQDDIYLNGKLGTEYVLEDRRATSYMMAFLVGSRLWILANDSRKVRNGNLTTPKDVRQFFDSFTFWE